MGQWTPEMLFVLTYCVSGLTGIGMLLLEKRPLSARLIFGTILVNGGVGSVLGMLAYEWLGGRLAPWRVVASGMLVGGRVITLKDAKGLVRRMLGANSDGPKHD